MKHLDPIQRAKALYSLLKEQGFPDEYISGVRWCIEEIQHFESRAREAEDRAARMLKWLENTQKQLERVQREIGMRHGKVAQPTGNEVKFYGRDVVPTPSTPNMKEIKFKW